MVALPFPTSSAPGAIPGEGSGRLINAYAAKDGAEVRWYPTPGLTPIADGLYGIPRGGLLVGATLYLAREDRLIAYTNGSDVHLAGRLEGARPVTMARNNRAPIPDVVIVTEVGAFVTDGFRVTDYPGQVIGRPNSVSFLDGYFLFTYADGTIRATGTSATPGNTTELNDQSFTRAESNPDGLLRGTVSGGQFFAWGQSSVEVYDDAGTSPFPLSRASVIPVGLYGPQCVAGAQDGWDLRQIFVAADGTVRQLNGYAPEKISPRAVERFIAATGAASLLRACVYTFGGNAIWSLSSPLGTWEYNATVGEWHERRSRGLSRWRGETSVKAFGKWIIGDTRSTAICALDETARLEVGDPVTSRIESGGLKDFPARLRIPDCRVDLTVGQGDVVGADPTQTDPSCLISRSLDGGATWGNPLQRRIGGQGVFSRQIRTGQLGRTTTQGLRVAVEVSDPVPFSFAGATVDGISRRKPG